jgi:hypothetical protein
MSLKILFSLLLPLLINTSRIAYVIQPGTPVGIQNFIQTESGCNWAGVGGQVFNQNGTPVSGLIVKVSGEVEEEMVLIYAVTGSSTQLGDGGFEFFLADHPISTNSKLFLQLFDVLGRPISGQVSLSTYDNCSQNLLLINLIEKTLSWILFFPFSSK